MLTYVDAESSFGDDAEGLAEYNKPAKSVEAPADGAAAAENDAAADNNA